jgi:hypothetical protein
MKSRRIGILVSAIGTMLAAIALLASSALGAPKEGYERFAGCPEGNAEVFLCQRVNIHGGHFKMGSKDVPITNPIVLSGGLKLSGEIIFNSQGGLSKARQPIPGGLIGLTGLDSLLKALKAELLQVFAVTELAGTPFIKEGGQEAELPIKVHLESPLLGNNCYVGSNTEPINLNMTLGTTAPPKPNEPISGEEPVEGPSDLEGVLLLENGLYVDNSFAAPAASGCVLNLGLIPLNIDAVVNLQSGLPAKAGTNETKQIFDLEVVSPETVYP